MTEDEHYAVTGRLYARLEQETVQHKRTLEVLRQVKTGELDLERLEVSGVGWRILPSAEPVPILRGLTVDDIKDAAAGAAGE